MNYIPPPISYAKVNPLGQLVIGLENGTILNAGSVLGRAGIQGPTGFTGPKGPSGPMGPYVTNMTIDNKGELIYSLSNNTHKFNAGKVPGLTGPQGPKGNSITECVLRNNTLSFLLDNNKLITAGNIIGPTGPRGPIGMGLIGPTGPMGKPFKVSRVFTSDDVLFILDDNNTIHTCGYIGVTGPTGPIAAIQSVKIDDDGHLIINSDVQSFNAGYVLGTQGIIGPTGPRGRPGPMLRLKDIRISDSGDVLFTDEYERVYNAGTFPIDERITQLEKQVQELRELYKTTNLSGTTSK